MLRQGSPPLSISQASLHAHYTSLLATPASDYEPEQFLDTWLDPDEDFTADEVKEAVARLKHGKALGPSFLSAELL